MCLVFHFSEAKGDPQSPGSLRLKVSATKFFNKSVYAANSFPLCIKVRNTHILCCYTTDTHLSFIQTVFDGLFGTLTNGILRVLTMEFILHIIFRLAIGISINMYVMDTGVLSTISLCCMVLCIRATPAKLQIMSPLLMTALNKIIDLPESKEVRAM